MIAITATVLLMTKFARSTGAYAEASYLEEERGSLESLTRADFDGAGYNLTRPTGSGAGKEAVQFLANNDYNTLSPGTLVQASANASFAYSTRTVTSGTCLFQWTPATYCKGCWIFLSSTDGSGDAVYTFDDENGRSQIALYEVPYSGYVASNFGTGVPIPAHVPGDTYQIAVEAPNQQQPNRFVRYYRIRGGIRTILYTSQNPVPPFPQLMAANFSGVPHNTVNNISLIGAPLEYRQGNQTEFASLPFIGGVQLTSPITTVSNTNYTYILSGDKNTDASPARTTFSANSTQIDLKTPLRGGYATGDTVLLIDYGNTDPSNLVNAATAACVVTAVSQPDSVTTRLTLTRARQATPGIGGVWSSDTDHAHTFSPSETTVVKLAPPVTYALSTDSRLVRIEGSRASTIAFNVRSFTVTQFGSNPARSVYVSLVLAGEGFETANTSTDETRATVEFTSTPRAMNLASNQLNGN